MSATMRIVVLALVALLVTAGVTWAATRLVSERIGLSAEPLSAGRALAPPGESRGDHRSGAGDGSHHGGHSGGGTTTQAPPTTTTSPPTTTTTSPPTTTSPTTSGATTSTGESGDDGGGSSGHSGGADD